MVIMGTMATTVTTAIMTTAACISRSASKPHGLRNRFEQQIQTAAAALRRRQRLPLFSIFRLSGRRAMFKRTMLALTVVGALAIGAAMPKAASADWGHHGHHHHGHHGHWGGHHHGHWHGHSHFSYRPFVYPPVYYGGYYPVRTYYAEPYWASYYGGYYARPYYGYYGSGVVLSVGW
jgi:hypothetical protein